MNPIRIRDWKLLWNFEKIIQSVIFWPLFLELPLLMLVHRSRRTGALTYTFFDDVRRRFTWSYSLSKGFPILWILCARQFTCINLKKLYSALWRYLKNNPFSLAASLMKTRHRSRSKSSLAAFRAATDIE